MKKTLLFIAVLFYMSILFGQDVHISQNFMFPAVSNPAFAGKIRSGNLQFGTLYRNQAFTVTPNSYSTYFAFVNAKIESRFINDDNIGMALMFLKDNSGKGQLNTSKTALDIAYRFNFDSFLSNISLGTQVGYVSRYFGDFSAFSFEEDLLGTGFSESNGFNKNNYFDLGLGATLNFRLFEYSNLAIGFSSNHLNFGSDDTNSYEIHNIDNQLCGFLEFNTPINENLFVSPKFYYTKTSINREILLQTLLSYRYNDYMVNGGLGLRYGDAIQLLLGTEIGNWEVGLAYDVNISDLAQVSKYASGFELGLKFNYAVTKHMRKPKKDIRKLFSKSKIDKTDKAKLKEIEEIEKRKKRIVVKKEQPIILNDILFDYDDDKILKEAESDLGRLLELLRKYDNMVIELSSHTDCRGSEEYNLELSQRRAESSKKWLIERGIDADRIIAKGYGESKLRNHCKDGVNCTEEEHKMNRRTEFKIISGPTTVKY